MIKQPHYPFKGSSTAPILSQFGVNNQAALASGPQVFTGSALGNFSNSNTVSSAANQLINFAPGTTLWIILQNIGTSAASTEVILACASATNGWVFSRAGANLGAQAGRYYFLTTASALNFYIPPLYGIQVLSIVWRASDKHFLMSANGLAQTSVGTVTQGSAVNAGCASYIGSPVSSFDGPLIANPDTRVLAFALWNTEATATQAQQATYRSGYRFALSQAVTSSPNCVIDFNATRDYNSSGFSTLGSSPIAFGVTGSPQLYACDEFRLATTNKNVFDGKISIPATDGNGVSYVTRDSYVKMKGNTSALSMTAELYSNNVTNNTPDYVGRYTNSTFISSFGVEAGTNSEGLPVSVEFNPGAGNNKQVSIWSGGQVLDGAGTPPLTREGVSLLAMRLPKYLTDGVTLANSSFIKYTSPRRRLVLLGDSIMTGFFVTNFPQETITALLRSDYQQGGTGGVTAHCAGTESMWNINKTSLSQTVSWLVAELDGTSSNTLWIQLGTNDYFANYWSPTNFGTFYGQLCDQVHSAVPNVSIYCQSPIQRIAPASEAANGSGFTLPNYRTAISNVAAARPSFCTYVDGSAGNIVSNANMYSDGVHLITAGDAQYKSFIKTTLNY